MAKDDVVSILNDLIETCKDGEYGFRLCAEHTTRTELKQLFAQRSTDCRLAAQELQALVVQHGGKPDDSGSVSGALHRGWVSVLGSFTGVSDKAMLDEAERGEDAALARYRKALRETNLPPEVRAVIERQCEGVQRNHDQVKALRDGLRASVS